MWRHGVFKLKSGGYGIKALNIMTMMDKFNAVFHDEKPHEEEPPSKRLKKHHGSSFPKPRATNSNVSPKPSESTNHRSTAKENESHSPSNSKAVEARKPQSNESGPEKLTVGGVSDSDYWEKFQRDLDAPFKATQ
ncbi:MAG: hypothetical protein Q9182_007288 [Xanthomendoza sp. 2 TL-2023]